MAIKLILTDIDGTILPRGQHAVSPRTVAAFHAALDAGIFVGPASGRGYAWIPDFFGGDTACCATALATNGMQVYVRGEKVMEQTLPPAALERIRQIVAETPHAGLLVFDELTPLLVAGAVSDLAVAFPSYAKKCVVTEGLPDFPVVKANVFVGTSADDAARLVARLNAEVTELDVDRALPTSSSHSTARYTPKPAAAHARSHKPVSGSTSRSHRLPKTSSAQANAGLLHAPWSF